MRHLPQSQRGFNIIEVMMVMAILTAGFIGLIQAVTVGSDFLDSARKREIAQQIATAEIEKLRGSSWSTLTSLAATGTITVGAAGTITGDTTHFALTNRTADTSDDNTALAALARGFTCSLTRTFLRPTGATASNATYLNVVYTVRWTSNTGRTLSHQVGAYFGKNGLHLSFQQS